MFDKETVAHHCQNRTFKWDAKLFRFPPSQYTAALDFILGKLTLMWAAAAAAAARRKTSWTSPHGEVVVNFCSSRARIAGLERDFQIRAAADLV